MHFLRFGPFGNFLLHLRIAAARLNVGARVVVTGGLWPSPVPGRVELAFSSYEPMAPFPATPPRKRPRWSVAGQAGKAPPRAAGLPALIAGLPLSSATLGVVPPLVAGAAAIMGLASTKSPGAPK